MWKGQRIPAAALTSAGVVLLVPVVLWAMNREPAELRLNRQRLREMPALKREQLEVRHAEFLALPPDEQEQYRQLHRELEQNPRLRSTLQRYQEWLETLSPWQRDELAGTSDAGTRRRLVEEFLTEQENDLSSRPLRYGQVRGRAAIPEADFQVLLNSMRDSLQPNDNELRQLEQLPPLQRAATVIRQVVQSQPRGRGNWPSEDEILHLQDELTSPPLKQALRKMQDPQRIRQLLLWATASHLEAGWRGRAAEYSPTPEQLADTFTELSDEEQDQLMRLSSDEQLAMLERKYLSQHPELRGEAGNLRRLLQLLRPESLSGPRSGGTADSGKEERSEQRPGPGGSFRPFAGRGPRGPGREAPEQGGRPGRLKPGRRNPGGPPGNSPRN